MYSMTMGFSPVYYTVDPLLLLPSGNPFKCHEEVLYIFLQTMVPPKRFDIFPSDWGMLRRGLDAFRVFFKLHCFCF